MTLRSRFGLMAYHGGNLEVGTDRIAEAVAERAGTSAYVIRQPPSLRWHIPSVRFRPEESPKLSSFLEHVDICVTLHGYGRRGWFTTVLLGGRNRALASHLAGPLRSRVPQYEIADRLEDIPVELRGLHPRNPVNLPAHAGVQVELPTRIRGNGPFWRSWDGGWPAPHTDALIHALVEAVSTWPPAVTEPGGR